MKYRKCLVKSDKEVINMVYLKYTSKYVCFMLHVCDNLADFHTSCFLFKSFSSFPYLSRNFLLNVFVSSTYFMLLGNSLNILALIQSRACVLLGLKYFCTGLVYCVLLIVVKTIWEITSLVISQIVFTTIKSTQ